MVCQENIIKALWLSIVDVFCAYLLFVLLFYAFHLLNIPYIIFTLLLTWGIVLMFLLPWLHMEVQIASSQETIYVYALLIWNFNYRYCDSVF